MRQLTRRSAAISLTALVGLSTAGAAWAAWRLTGTGTAQAKAGSVVDLQITGAGLAEPSLTPANATAVRLKVLNKNKFPVKITRIALNDLTSNVDGCVGVDNVDIVNDAPLPADVIVPAAATDAGASKEIVWSGPLRMKADPADACQNARFTFTVNLDAVSAAS